jgi:riboflavin kinase/FMN adenylyltransferase
MINIECDIFDIPNLSLGAVCIGKFDGFHTGHAHIIQYAQTLSKNSPSGILTFHPLPFVFFGKGFSTIYTQEEKVYIAQKLGVEYILQINFNEQLAKTNGEKFIEKISNITKNIVVGKGFRFGVNQSCGEAELIAWQEKYGYTAHILQNITNDSGKISSTMLRACVNSGNFAAYNAISNIPFFCIGSVQKGAQFASKMNFPTANCLMPANKLMPHFGVYATKIFVDNTSYYSISNYGVKPTIQNDGLPILETHILNYNGDLYHKQVRVEFIEKIRNEQKFQDINQLKFQISQDIVRCKTIHGL